MWSAERQAVGVTALDANSESDCVAIGLTGYRVSSVEYRARDRRRKNAFREGIVFETTRASGESEAKVQFTRTS